MNTILTALQNFDRKRKKVFPGSFLVLLMVLILFAGCSPESKLDVRALTASGDKAMDERSWGQAIDEYSKILTENPNNGSILYRRAAAYLAKAKDHYNLAEAAVNKNEITTAEEEAKNADLNFGKAESDAREAIKFNANDANTWYVLGCIYIYQGEWRGAIDSFTRCTKIRPKDPFAWQRRGEVFEHTGDNASALIDFRKAAELGYRTPDAEKKKESKGAKKSRDSQKSK